VDPSVPTLSLDKVPTLRDQVFVLRSVDEANGRVARDGGLNIMKCGDPESDVEYWLGTKAGNGGAADVFDDRAGKCEDGAEVLTDLQELRGP
jgi:hypothetical protein